MFVFFEVTFNLGDLHEFFCNKCHIATYNVERIHEFIVQNISWVAHKHVTVEFLLFGLSFLLRKLDDVFFRKMK